jgi:hypothetical protein
MQAESIHSQHTKFYSKEYWGFVHDFKEHTSIHTHRVVKVAPMKTLPSPAAVSALATTL